MTFTVTYRGSDGAVRTVAVDAANREACLALMRTKGIVPMSVKEGWSGRSAAKDAAKKSPIVAYKVLLVASVALAIIGGGAWWWVAHQKPKKPSVVPEPTVVKPETKPTVAPKTVNPEKLKPTVASKTVKPASATKEVEPVLTVQGENVNESELTATNETEVVETPKKEKLFKHGAEQLLALATPASPGMSVPPLPAITDESVAEDLKKAMSNVITASPDDTEHSLKIKSLLVEQKEEFRELRAGGMTFPEYVNALRDKFNDDAKFLSEAQKMDEDLFQDAQVSDEDYKAYRNELNKHLKERGLPELEERESAQTHRGNGAK